GDPGGEALRHADLAREWKRVLQRSMSPRLLAPGMRPRTTIAGRAAALPVAYAEADDMPRIACRRWLAETIRLVANAARERRTSKLLRLATVSVALVGCHGSAAAADWPARPVRFVVGPGPDVLARLLGQQLTERWGQQVVIDQRPGAGGIIAAETVAKATADGHTLLLTTGSYTINHTLRKKLPYDLTR